MMQFYEPAIRLAVFSWARKTSCNYFYPKLINYLAKTITIDALTNNSLDTLTTSSICNKGIDMYFENYYTLGNAELPWATTFTWAGTPTD
jgi:hypothetical protein